MGCGASTENGPAATAAAPVAKNKAPVDDGFSKDVIDFILKVLTDEEYSENLLKTLQEQDNPENRVEKLLKMVISIVGTVVNVTAPKHDMGEFIIGCLIAFFVHLAENFKTAPKQMDLPALQALGYHVDAKWANAVYDKEGAADPKTALAEAMAQEPLPQAVKPEDVAYFRPDSQLGKPAVAVALDHARGLILVVVRGTANVTDAVTDLAGSAAPWCDGYAHESVAMAAKALFEETRELVLQLKAANPAYGVRTVGHSLGGGTAGCLALLMHRDEEFAAAVYGSVARPGPKSKGLYMITSAGFGSAAVLSKELTEEVHRYVTTIVHDSDLVPRLCTSTISDFIVLADVLVDVFKVVGDVMAQLLDGKTPEGYDDFTVIALIAKAASDPAGLLRELLEAKMESAGEAVVAAAESDPKRLYAPGRLVLLARSEQGPAYSISRGSMAGSAGGQLLMKGSMLADHAMAAYLHAVSTGQAKAA